MSNQTVDAMRQECSSHTNQYASLEKRLEVTKMAIEEEMRDETARHEREVSEIVEAARDELIELARLARETHERQSERAEKRRELESLVYKVIVGLSSRQRVSLESKLTLRDGEVFIYNQSNRAGLYKIRSNAHLFEAEDAIETDCEAWKKMMSALEDIEVTSGWRDEKKVAVRENLDEPVLEDLDCVEYNSRSTSRMALKKQGSYSSKLDLPLHRSDYKDPVEHYDFSSKFKKLKALVAFLPELTSVYEEARDRYVEQIERREDALNTIQQAAAKQLVAASI